MIGVVIKEHLSSIWPLIGGILQIKVSGKKPTAEQWIRQLISNLAPFRSVVDVIGGNARTELFCQLCITIKTKGITFKKITF